MFKGLSKWGLDAPVYVPLNDAAAAGAQLDRIVFVSDDYYEVLEARLNHAVNGGAGAQVDVKKMASGGTIAGGSSVLGSVFVLASGALTSQRRNASASGVNGLTATLANRQLVPSDCLVLDYGGTLTGLIGVGGSVVLQRTRKTQRR